MKIKELNYFLILSGRNQRAIFSFCRFCDKHRINFLIITSSAKDSIYESKYKENVVGNVDGACSSPLKILDCLERIKSKVAVKLLYMVPTTDSLVYGYFNNRDSFLAHDVVLPVCEEDVFKMVDNKESFSNLCAKNGLLTPNVYNKVDSATLPCVLKPRYKFCEYTGETLSPIIVTSEKELKENSCRATISQYFIQEYVEGESYYLLYYVSRENKDVMFSQKNLLQQDRGESIIAASSSLLHHESIAEGYLNLFKSIGFSGLVMVELRERNGMYYLIEANPRLWGPSQLFVDAEVPIFTAFCHEIGMGFEDFSKPEQNYKEAFYFWHGGMFQIYQNNRNFAFYSGIDESYCLDALPYWMEHDIYRRSDTYSIYINQSFLFKTYLNP